MLYPLPQPEQEPDEQEPQEEDADEDLNLSPLLCANTLSFFSTLPDLQPGQQTFSAELLTSSSNSFRHFLHLYSNSGISIPPAKIMSTQAPTVNILPQSGLPLPEMLIN